MSKEIILASSSPRRIEMIKAKGIDPVIIIPGVDETITTNMKPHDAVMFLALKKALHAESTALERGYNGNAVIAADTIVVYNNIIIGKPNDSIEAYDILKALNGNVHTVLTGVSIIFAGITKRKVFYETTKVFFKDYSDYEITEYVKTSEPYDKAGGYAIQGAWGKHIDRIEGDYDNVIGFPWSKISEHLALFNVI